MKIVFTFIFTLFFLCNSFAQKEKDSLKSIWSNNKLHDSTRLKIINDLIMDHYFYNKTDSALLLGKQMLALAKEKKKNVKFEIEAYTIIGDIYFEKEENDKATESYTKGLDLALFVKDSLLYANELYNLGESYRNYEDYTNAYKIFKKSREFSKIIGDSVGEGWSIDRLGLIHRDLGNFEEAEKYHLEHLRLSTEYGIKHSISGAHGNLGGFYRLKGDISKSIFHWNEGIRIAKEIGEPIYASKGTSNLISIYIDEKDYANASKYLEEYKSVIGHLKNPSYKVNILLYQCQIDYGLGNYTKALKECEACLKITKTNNWNPRSKLIKSLYEVNKKLNRHKIALAFFEQYQLSIDDKKEDIARTEIQNIIFNNQLVADSIAQAQEKELLNLTYEEGLRKKNRENNLFIVIGLLVLLIAAAYFIISRRIAAKERKRLKEVDQLKNALFTNITHEFRTPLTVIKGMTGHIKSDLNNKQHDNLENALDIIDRNSDNLLNLINEMLDLAKIESGNMELNLVQVDSIPFTKYLTQSFHSLAEEKNINFSVNCELEHLNMDLDVNKFTAIVTNLLSNAIKFTSQNGEVEVHIDKFYENNSSFFTLKVRDNGLGISKKEQLHIFDKFYQVDNSASKLQKGTGIGLALVKDFVELMHGSIDVSSTQGKGSIFSIKIPITNNTDQSSSSELVSESSLFKSIVVPTASDNNLTTNKSLPLVLIAEDNMDVAHYIKTCLKGNYQILHAHNGRIGIEIALDKIPDIIISDVMMPEKDGFEVCEHLKTNELTNHIPIIMLTAKATFEDRLTGLSHGADAYLTKPFEKEELLTRITQLILLRKKMLNKFEKTGIERLLDKNVKNSETKFLEKVITTIHENISEVDFSPKQLTRKLNLSESQLYRKLKATTGKSTAVFIRSIRLQKGKELIETTNKTISEVAYDVGFNDPSYFSRAFKVEFGDAPSTISK